MSVAIGIDLGTTNTVVAAVVDGVAVTLEDEQGRRLLPSVVSFHPSSTVLVGQPARERRLIDPENTIFSVKPLLGRAWDSDEVQSAKPRFPFKLAMGAKNSTMALARDVAYALPEISAFVLRRAKAIAEAALGQPVERAVITVPANFNDLQRASTKIAGKLAGLEVMRILNEPTAAALAYGQSIAKREKIAVYDLGGGTFDVTLLELTSSVFEVLATAGDTALGGDDIDHLLADKIAIDVLKRFNIDPRTNPASLTRLAFMAEEIKKELSSSPQSRREIIGLGSTEGGHPISMPFVMTREELEVLARPLVERTMAIAAQSIEIVGLFPRDFDRIILVGGSTRIPVVGRMVEQLFGRPPHLKVNPDEVVALGAAIQAHALNRSNAAHRRGSSHHPPNADPASVPKAPALPTNMGVSPLPAERVPDFLSFNKGPAVISFSGMPGAPSASRGVSEGSASPPIEEVPPPPRAPKPASPSMPNRGHTDHVAQVTGARSSTRPIEGVPARNPTDDGPTGPKPARRSGAPSVPVLAVPDGAAPAMTAAHGIVAVPELDVPLASRPPERQQPGELEERVTSGELFRDLDRGARPAPERFQQGSAVTTSASTPLLIDVTPLSLGVETVGGYTDVLIPANSPVPCEKTRTFRTASDGQTVVWIRVGQGESRHFAANTRLGDLELSGLRPAGRGEVKIAVTFELDVDGILNVRARDHDTGRETTATMRLVGANTDAEDIGAMAARQARHHVA